MENNEGKNELLETGVQLGAWDARLLFAAQGEADRDLWRKVDLIRRQGE